MNKARITYSNLLFVLPHLDDEFAVAPILKIYDKRFFRIKILFCAERLNDDKKSRIVRRNECYSSLNLFGINSKDIIFLNDFFLINDCMLYKSSNMIYKYILDLDKKYNFKKIFTLALEGGHPDHDALALLIDKFSKKNQINSYFFPAYNSDKYFFFPYSVLKPLNTCSSFAKFIKIPRTYWIYSLRVTLEYKSERKALIKIIPFILLKIIHSQKVFFFTTTNKNLISWEKSLTVKRYNVILKEILDQISII